MSDTVRFDQTVMGAGPAPEDRFASAWDDSSTPPLLTEFLPQEGEDGYLGTLERLIQIEIEQSWRRASHDGSGRPRSVEDYLERFPALRSPETIRHLARSEFIARHQYGDHPDAQSYVERFPQYITADSAADFLTAANRALAANGGSATTDLGMLGGYQLLEQIGEGGMGVVYRALQPGANRVVALKVIRLAVTGAGDAFRAKAETRFRNEIQAASKLEHENIVPVYDAGSVGELMYFAMRFVEGKSLNDLVKAGPLENQLAAKYIAGAARGVAEAHRQGILHRDLKPHNVMVESRTGQPMVADFGLAKLIDAEDQVTKTGEALGTPSYMPPEQISDAGKVDQRGDVYSLGATLYHLVTGRPPFQAANTLGTMRQVLYDEPVPPKRLNSAVDVDVETIALKCLQKEPARRYQTADEFLADLDRFLRGEPILARPIGRLERLNRWRRRNPVEAGLTATAVVLTLVALAATTIGYRNTKAALNEAEVNLAVAKSAIDELYTEVSEIDLENQPGLQPLKKTLLVKALAYYQRLLERQNRGDALTSDLAMSEFRVGTIMEEVQSVNDALPHFLKAAEIQRELLKSSPGRRELAAQLSDSLNSIGRAQQRMQSLTAAERAYDEARGLRQKLVDLAPDDREYQRKLANVIMNGGLLKVRKQDFETAAADYASSQFIRQKLLEQSFDERVARDFARGAFNQGILERDRERFEESSRFLRAAVGHFRKLVDMDPDSLSDRFELAVASVILGDVLSLTGADQDALNSYATGRSLLESLVRENPKVIGYRERMGVAVIGEAQLHLDLAAMLGPESGAPDSARATSHREKAESLLRQGATTLSSVIADEADRSGPRHDLALVYLLLGDVKQQQGDKAAARDAWTKGCETLEPLKEKFDRNQDCAAKWDELQKSIKSLESPAMM